MFTVAFNNGSNHESGEQLRTMPLALGAAQNLNPRQDGQITEQPQLLAVPGAVGGPEAEQVPQNNHAQSTSRHEHNDNKNVCDGARGEHITEQGNESCQRRKITVSVTKLSPDASSSVSRAYRHYALCVHDFGLGAPLSTTQRLGTEDKLRTTASLVNLGDQGESKELAENATYSLASASRCQEEMANFFQARQLLHGSATDSVESNFNAEMSSASKKQKISESTSVSCSGRPVASPMFTVCAGGRASRNQNQVEDIDMWDDDEALLAAGDMLEQRLFNAQQASVTCEGANAEKQMANRPQDIAQSTSDGAEDMQVSEDASAVPRDETDAKRAKFQEDKSMDTFGERRKSLKEGRMCFDEAIYMSKLQKSFDVGEPPWLFGVYCMPEDRQLARLLAVLPPKLRRRMNLWYGENIDLEVRNMMNDRRFWTMHDELFQDRMMVEMELYNRKKVMEGRTKDPMPYSAHFVVVLGCAGINTGLICVQDVFEIFKRTYSQEFSPQILSIFIYENDPAAIEAGKLITDKLSVDIDVSWRGSIDHWPDDVDLLTLYPDTTRFICLGSTECNNISYANQKVLPAGTSGLHGSKSRTYFPWHQGLKKLTEIIGSDQVCCMSELPFCKDKEDEKLLDAQMGVARSVDAKDWNHHANRRRSIRCSPVVEIAVIKPSNHMVSGESPVMFDGSTWAPTKEALAVDQAPAVLRRYWPRLIVRHAIEKDKRLTQYEQQTLASLRVRMPTGQVLFAGVPFYLTHLGLQHTPLRNLMEMFPCMKSIDNVSRPGTGPGFFSCGEMRLCNECSKAIQLLGACWHRHSISEALSRSLLPALCWWMGLSQKPTFWEFKVSHHECGPTCTRRPPF